MQLSDLREENDEERTEDILIGNLGIYKLLADSWDKKEKKTHKNGLNERKKQEKNKK